MRSFLPLIHAGTGISNRTGNSANLNHAIPNFFKKSAGMMNRSDPGPFCTPPTDNMQ
jgi:hypothetical protein